MGETWTWSTGLSEYREWGEDQPDDSHDCVTISSKSKDMATRDCSSRIPFICFNDNLILVKENKTWEESLEHCRGMRSDYHQDHRYELVSVQPGYEHSILMTTIEESDTEEVWAGLRFMEGHWWWVNGADMRFDLPICPVQWQHCGALSKNDTVAMKNRDCLEKKNFLCYRKN
ncbi:secretory phospholipase A2 receptor-like [Cheilinus undulatus]|uniref:secretory phospholipase A2 receptor-like n=1 Tax=Cheilinus undulatus TaxID=241271 RepID=UPI001BD2CD3E|nr:secretory phospholipase A2 receptor-like [Cheilinus undulatus]